MIDDLSGAFAWTPPDEAHRIREESDVKRAYGELRAEWVTEQARKKRTERGSYLVITCLVSLMLVLGCLWFGAMGGL